jgi:hypothetical protein
VRKRRTSSQTSATVSIRVNRKLFALAVIFLSVIVAVGLSRAASSGNVVAALIVLVVIGGPCLLYVRGLFRRGPAIIISSEGLGGFRVGRIVPWASVSDIHVAQQQSIFGVTHQLVLTVRRDDRAPIKDSLGLLTSRIPTETVEFSIDQLAMPWSEIVALVQDRLGRDISTKRQTLISAVRGK